MFERFSIECRKTKTNNLPIQLLSQSQTVVKLKPKQSFQPITKNTNNTASQSELEPITRSWRDARENLCEWVMIGLVLLLNKGWKFLKKLWGCVGGGNNVIWLYQLSLKCKLATVTSYKADVFER